MRRLMPLLFWLGCGGSSVPGSAPASATVTGSASASASASVTASATASASGTTSASAPADLRARHKAAYAQATAAASHGDIEGAIQLLTAIKLELRECDDDPLCYWIHNELTWLYWARRDNPGALAETMSGKAALDRSKLPDEKVRSMRLHQLWDAAYLLLDLALAKPPGERAAAMAVADAAQRDYETLARAQGDRNGMAVLQTFFFLRKGDVTHAAMSTDRVDVAHDDDVQDLYVLAAALQRVGASDKAGDLRRRICDADTYLMKPLIVAQLARDGYPCPTTK